MKLWEWLEESLVTFFEGIFACTGFRAVLHTKIVNKGWLSTNESFLLEPGKCYFYLAIASWLIIFLIVVDFGYEEIK